ncbi:DUF805 domain-containing protein [Taibaiella sp. KBW10]|nr:DUF805 domain-containing protein [Taibaiella sp. KBW10]
MVDYFKRGLQNYTNFNGRDTRPQFWWYYLGYFIIALIVNFISRAMGSMILPGILALIMFLPTIAAGVRRMHDLGKSGWFILIPIYNIVLLATEGQQGQNEYGPDPRNPAGNSFDFDQKQFHQ